MTETAPNDLLRKKPSRSSQFRIEQMDGEYLLYSVNETRTIYLNDTAVLVFNACNGELTVGEIVSALSEAYPDAKDAIGDDVVTVLREFENHGAIELA